METDAPLLTRRDRERLARREAMLDAALAVFGEHGFEGATLDGIADRAEFGKGTLYNYFPGGKDELFHALFEEHVVSGLRAVVARALPDDRPLDTAADARAGFHDLLLGLLEHFEANRSVLRLFMTEGPRALHDPDRMADLVDQFAGLTDAVAAAVERSMAAGAIRALPPLSVAHLLFGNVRGLLLAHAAHDCARPGAATLPPLDPAETAAFLTTVLFDGLLAR
ncbi:TetR/AcrR family transcriptional regulator [Rubrivirga sp. IMCC45206]|uniref:TetR/AcrR family transcriptional regulator n=1 Tax=Rubrivirga sp. IMCC45206 TaxID=3391614 RepID=UPI00398FC46B